MKRKQGDLLERNENSQVRDNDGLGRSREVKSQIPGTFLIQSKQYM